MQKWYYWYAELPKEKYAHHKIQVYDLLETKIRARGANQTPKLVRVCVAPEKKNDEIDQIELLGSGEGINWPNP
jgi:ribosomal protein L31E